jgi:nitrite reductase/ring-hydroxylating ferredoxin subunit
MAGKERLSQLSERLSQLSERLSQPSERPSQTSARGSALGEGANEAVADVAGARARLICASSDLVDGGDGVRFDVECEGEDVPAFAIRYGGRVYAYVNRCAHIAMELDWTPGKFFDVDGEHLICSTHGALYAPESGACRGGPCRGAALNPLDVFEADGKIYLRKD